MIFILKNWERRNRGIILLKGNNSFLLMHARNKYNYPYLVCLNAKSHIFVINFIIEITELVNYENQFILVIELLSGK